MTETKDKADLLQATEQLLADLAAHNAAPEANHLPARKAHYILTRVKDVLEGEWPEETPAAPLPLRPPVKNP